MQMAQLTTGFRQGGSMSELNFKEISKLDEINELKQLLQLPSVNEVEIFEILRCF